MEVCTLLKLVRSGGISLEQAEQELKKLPYEEMNFAKLDHHRKLRSGCGEVIYCAGKRTEHLVSIFQRLYEENQDAMGTRATQKQYLALKEKVPRIRYDEVSRIVKLEARANPQIGCIAVCTAGTSDISVAEEAAQTAEFFGNRVLRIYDVGVAGIHRLFAKLEEIRSANCIIAIAGMEGALAGVVAGLVDKPVIAVPTSIGYGANFHGLSALLTMLNSCSEGIAVVNIDNGFGAGYLGSQINHLAISPPETERLKSTCRG